MENDKVYICNTTEKTLLSAGRWKAERSGEPWHRSWDTPGAAAIVRRRG